MRERVKLLGGSLSAAPTTDGGFSVTAVLPIESAGTDSPLAVDEVRLP
jgi:signal transduction histidine kinase